MQNGAANVRVIRGAVRPFIPKDNLGAVAPEHLTAFPLRQGGMEPASYTGVDFSDPEMVARYGDLCFTTEHARPGTRSLFLEEVTATVYPTTRNVLLSSSEAEGVTFEARRTVVVRDFPEGMTLSEILPRLPAAYIRRHRGLSPESIMGEGHRAALAKMGPEEQEETLASWAATWLVTDDAGAPVLYLGHPQYGRNQLVLRSPGVEPEDDDRRAADLERMAEVAAGLAAPAGAYGSPFPDALAASDTAALPGHRLNGHAA